VVVLIGEVCGVEWHDVVRVQACKTCEGPAVSSGWSHDRGSQEGRDPGRELEREGVPRRKEERIEGGREGVCSLLCTRLKRKG